MSPAHQNLIEKIFIKNTLLTIITKNPSGYQELNHDNTKKSIKFLIKIYAKENPLSPFEQIEEIKVFSRRYLSEPKITSPIKQNTYLELSNGLFVNHCENPILFQKFENLRKAIQKCSNKN
ncbi:hypothetical protein [Campylobacter sp. US33a]|nr:hypothetical protein [Campylobacter sp. US33a]